MEASRGPGRRGVVGVVDTASRPIETTATTDRARDELGLDLGEELEPFITPRTLRLARLAVADPHTSRRAPPRRSRGPPPAPGGGCEDRGTEQGVRSLARRASPPKQRHPSTNKATGGFQNNTSTTSLRDVVRRTIRVGRGEPADPVEYLLRPTNESTTPVSWTLPRSAFTTGGTTKVDMSASAGRGTRRRTRNVPFSRRLRSPR